MSTDTNLTNLVINDLTEEQYQAAIQAGTVNANELYLTDGEDGGATWGSITGTLSNQTDLNTALNAKQATLTAGTGINISSSNVISCTASGATWGSITGTLSNQTDLNTALNAKANLSSPSFTGVPTAPTASSGTSTTQIASTAFVQQEIASAIGNIETALSNI